MTRVYIMPKVLILTFISLLFFWPLKWYYILLIILGSLLIVSIYHILEMYLHGKYYLYLIKKGRHISKEKIYSIVHRYMALVNRILRMDVIVENYERFDKNKNYLIVPNHQSNADATVMMETFKSPILFVSKFSMSKVPLVKEWMNLMGCLFLKKDDMRGQIIIMNEVAEKLINGESVIIFPEGRRSFKKELNEFKPGTFKMATKTKVDILPVTSNNVYKLRHRFPWRQTEVHVYIHEPIPYETYKDMTTQDISKMVQDIVETKIED